MSIPSDSLGVGSEEILKEQYKAEDTIYAPLCGVWFGRSARNVLPEQSFSWVWLPAVFKTFEEVLVAATISALISLPIYFIVAFQGNWIVFWLAHLLVQAIGIGKPPVALRLCPPSLCQ